MPWPTTDSNSARTAPNTAPAGAWREPILRAAERRLIERGLRRETRRLYLARIRRLLTELRQPPDRWTAGALRRLLEWAPGHAARAQNRTVLRFLVCDVLGRPELALVLRPETTLPPPPTLSPGGVRRVMAELPQPRWREFVTLLYGSGLRLREALALRVGQVELEAARIRVEDAAGIRLRTTVLPRRLVNPLRLRLSALTPATLVYPNPRGDVLHPRAVQRRIARAGERAGLEGAVTATALRRAFGAHLVSEGVEAERVDAMLRPVVAPVRPVRCTLPEDAFSPVDRWDSADA